MRGRWFPETKMYLDSEWLMRKSQDPHRAALGQEGDLVAFLHAQGKQAGADAVGFVAGLFLGDFRPLAVDFLAEVYVVGKLPGVFFDKVDDGRSFCHIHVVY